MAEELQGLLDRIQQDGIDRAESEAAKIVEDARKKAEQIVADAQKQAETKLKQAEQDAGAFETRSTNALHQTARDVVLSVEDAVANVFQSILEAQVEKALSGEKFQALLLEVVSRYANDSQSGSLDVMLSDEQKEAVNAYLMKEAAEQIRQGLTVKGTRAIRSGFSVSVKDQGIEHDFSGDALVAAFEQLLRPQLAEIVKNAMQKVK